jgi:hypothetical protein
MMTKQDKITLDMKWSVVYIFMLTIGYAGLLQADEPPDVQIQFIQTKDPTSFSPILQMRFKNPGYTSLDLADRMASSQLFIDNKPFPRAEPVFEGPPGLPAQVEWEACLPLSDYAVEMTPGKHHVLLKMGDASSNEEMVTWPEPVNWRKGNMKSRLKEVRDMAASLKGGTPRSCVEEWLTTKDGGLQDNQSARYYLEPQIKVSVSYQKDVVHGPVKVYQEPRLLD